jgi:hypothetical protein
LGFADIVQAATDPVTLCKVSLDLSLYSDPNLDGFVNPITRELCDLADQIKMVAEMRATEMRATEMMAREMSFLQSEAQRIASKLRDLSASIH